MKVCICCSMQTKEVYEFAGGDTSKYYCIPCARADGAMQLFEEKNLV